MRVLISAGEASGEMYGAGLIRALRGLQSSQVQSGRLQSAQPEPSQYQPEMEFFGAGGERMRAAGCEIVVDCKDLSVVGITEIIGRLSKIYRLFHHLIAQADQRKPHAAIVIDSPAFNWRVARAMSKRGIPVIYYVAPQFWAWRQGRVKLLRKYVKKALVIFPFEEKFYRDRGVNAEFIGHPLADLPQPQISRDDYAAQNHLDPAKQWVAIMPGSRPKEVRMNLPAIIESVANLGNRYEYLLPVAPTLNRDFLRALLAQYNVAASVHLVAEALPALHHSRTGIIASGTATVEAAIMQLPFVMVYRVSPLTYLLGKPRVKVPRFCMVNLIAGKEVVPELVQQQFTAENVIAELRKILPDGPAREKMLSDLKNVKASLRGGLENQTPPADRAAQIICKGLKSGVFQP